MFARVNKSVRHSNGGFLILVPLRNAQRLTIARVTVKAHSRGTGTESKSMAVREIKTRKSET